jgi:hypothetical protein
MKQPFRALLVASAVVMAAGPSSLADMKIGKVLEGQNSGADIFAGETISTPASSSTILQFFGGVKLQLGPNSSVILGSGWSKLQGAIEIQHGFISIF